MLTVRGVETRLRKLEVKRRPAGAFFLAWGRSEAEIERTVADAKAGGSIGRGDTLVRVLWTGQDTMPASRWIGSCRGDLSPDEEDALTAELERLCAEVHSPEEITASVTAPRDLQVMHMTDAQLLAVALGKRVQ